MSDTQSNSSSTTTPATPTLKSPRDSSSSHKKVYEKDEVAVEEKKRKKSVLARVFKTSKKKSSSNSALSPSDSSPVHHHTPTSHHAVTFVEEPMPDDHDEIEQRFLEAIDQLGIQDEDKRNILISRYSTPQLKWRMVMDAERSRAQLMSGKGSNPQYFIDTLKSISTNTILMQSKPLASEIQNLNVHVRNQQLKWLNDFIRMDGLEEILVVLATASNIQEP